LTNFGEKASRWEVSGNSQTARKVESSLSLSCFPGPLLLITPLLRQIGVHASFVLIGAFLVVSAIVAQFGVATRGKENVILNLKESPFS
jgi:hypothetical protein